jgi:transposase InsO family protein
VWVKGRSTDWSAGGVVPFRETAEVLAELTGLNGGPETICRHAEMAGAARHPASSSVIYSDQGTQYGSGPSLAAPDASLLLSMGAVGTRYDNAVMESFYSSM